MLGDGSNESSDDEEVGVADAGGSRGLKLRSAETTALPRLPISTWLRYLPSLARDEMVVRAAAAAADEAAILAAFVSGSLPPSPVACDVPSAPAALRRLFHDGRPHLSLLVASFLLSPSKAARVNIRYLACLHDSLREEQAQTGDDGVAGDEDFSGATNPGNIALTPTQGIWRRVRSAAATWISGDY